MGLDCLASYGNLALYYFPLLSLSNVYVKVGLIERLSCFQKGLSRPQSVFLDTWNTVMHLELGIIHDFLIFCSGACSRRSVGRAILLMASSQMVAVGLIVPDVIRIVAGYQPYGCVCC